MLDFVASMAWQDLVLAIGGFIIAAGIIPTILSPAKPPIATTVIITVTLAIFTATFASLGLWFTVAATAAQGVLWAIVLWQTVRARSMRQTQLGAHIGMTEPVVAVEPLGFEEFEREELADETSEAERTPGVA